MTQECGGVAGKVAPVVDRNRCEGKAACVRVCPYNVFAMGLLTQQQRRELRLAGKVKAWAHGWKQAMVVNGGDCHACQLCIKACPEQALTLAPIGP
jgi:NAD-dependent dihydropyrimidine dehydrogenase PreA subunit